MPKLVMKFVTGLTSSPTIPLENNSLSKKKSKHSIEMPTKKKNVCYDRMCSKCDEDLPSSEFYKGRNQCKACCKKTRALAQLKKEPKKKEEAISRLKKLLNDLNEVAEDAITFAKKTVKKVQKVDTKNEEKFFEGNLKR